ncbi:uncharacterized protein HGUI_02579 [Hanseniaspora guilliermondii]|uniref:Uncharacterized protein n=1 Tax=Hanseniaspora guilliermondii TaxID=56406 RepID=A0A1L0B5Q5_9ASCO|nr:uncharacterized protein HGUI_02579 [Hanseniaspora guilliermondii]
MNFLNIHRWFGKLSKVQPDYKRFSSTNNIIFNYHLDVHHINPSFSAKIKHLVVYEEFMDRQMMNMVRRNKFTHPHLKELKTIDDYKNTAMKSRTKSLISLDHSHLENVENCDDHVDVFNDHVRNVFYYETFLKSDTSVRYYIRAMKYTNFCIDINQLNYIIKNIIKSGRYNEVDEVLEELHVYDSIKEQEQSMLKPPTLLTSGFFETLFQRNNEDTIAKIELLDNIIKVYYELNDYRYLKELIRYRERFHTDKIIDTEIMFIKVNWRINSNYNVKYIVKIINDFVQYQDMKYEKMDRFLFYKVLDQLFSTGDIELISFFLNSYKTQFDPTIDPLVVLMMSRFKSHYVEDTISNMFYYLNNFKYQIHFKEYSLKSEIHQCGRLLHLVNKQIDISLILNSKHCRQLMKTNHQFPIGSYFIEKLLKINSKKIINQKTVFNFLNKHNIVPLNLDGTSNLDLTYYRMLLAYELKDMKYFTHELSKSSFPKLMEYFELYLKIYRDFFPKMADNMLIVLINISMLEYHASINQKLIDFNRKLAFYKLDQEKINKLIFGNYNPSSDGLLNIQRLHNEDKIFVSRYIMKRWKDGYDNLLGKDRSKDKKNDKDKESDKEKDNANDKEKDQKDFKNSLPPTETLLSLNRLFRNPFIEENLKKKNLLQAISLNYYIKFILNDYDEYSFDDFLLTKTHFKYIFPVELILREFHRLVAIEEIKELKEANESVSREIATELDPTSKKNQVLIVKGKLERRWYNISFEHEVNDQYIEYFIETLKEFEQTTKTLVPKRDLMRIPYFRRQFQTFMEKCLALMFYHHRYLAASMVLKRYLWCYIHNFMSETPEPLFEAPSYKMKNISEDVKASLLNLFGVNEESFVLYDAIFENLKSLSVDAESELKNGKIIISNKLIDDLPYKNKKVTQEDMMATRIFFEDLKNKFPRLKLYWVLKIYDEIKKSSTILSSKNKKNTEQAKIDLMIVYNNLKQYLK